MAYKFQMGAAKLSGSITAEGAVSGTSLAADSALAISEGGTGQTALDDIVGGTGIIITDGAGTVVGGDVTIGLSAQLQEFNGLSNANGNFVVGDGNNFVVESGATARTSLGLGDAAEKTVGVGNGNVLAADNGIEDDDFLRVNGSVVEGLSAAETLTAIGAQPLDSELTELATMAANTAAALADLENTEVALLDGASALNNTPSKAVVLDSSGDLTISGSLQVNGDLTYVNTTNLRVTDAKVVIADSAANLEAGQGIYIGSDADTADKKASFAVASGSETGFSFSSSLTLEAPTLMSDDAYINAWEINGTNISGNLPITASAFVGSGAGLTGISADQTTGITVRTYSTGSDVAIDLAGVPGFYSAQTDDGTSANAITLDLSGTWADGDLVIVKAYSNVVADTRPLTINASGTFIDGESSVVLESNGAAVSLIRTGDVWQIF